MHAMLQCLGLVSLRNSEMLVEWYLDRVLVHVTLIASFRQQRRDDSVSPHATLLCVLISSPLLAAACSLTGLKSHVKSIRKIEPT